MAEVKVSQTGLGSPERQDSFRKGLKNIIDSWSTTNSDQRLKAINDVVNGELAHVGVTRRLGVFPGVGGVGGSTYGKLLSQSWILSLAGDGLKTLATTPGGFAELADTIYHETRHAEQFFRTAALVARRTKKPDADAIAATLNMDGLAVAAAIEAKLKLSKSEEAEADDWATSIPLALEVSNRLTDFVDKYDTAFKAVNALVVDYGKEPRDSSGKLTNLAAFRPRFDKVDSDFKAARKQYVECYKLYLFLAHERDAWQLGTAMNELFGGNPPAADAKLAALGQDMLKNLENFDGLLKS